MKRDAEMMPSVTNLLLQGLRPMSGEDALEFASLEDPELDAQRRLLKVRDRGEESSAWFLRGRRRRPRRRRSSS